MSTDLKPLLVDIRIPYCIRPEHFRSRTQLVGSNEEKNAYLAAVKRELESYADTLEGYEVQALRLGGGAATVMSPDLLGDLLKRARKVLPVAHGAEFSVDTHPYTVGTPALTGIGIGQPNRFELMMTSANDTELATMGCAHRMQHLNNAVLFFHRFRISNFGLTVSIGIPGQTISSWENTLHACCILRPPHISLERLTPEQEAKTGATEGVTGHASADDAYAARPSDPGLQFPDSDACFAMYQSARDILAQSGYVQYGAQHFCLPHFASRFALLRMENTPCLGIGLGAVTHFDGYLTRNTNNLRIYLSGAGDYEKTTAQILRADTEYEMQAYVNARMTSPDGLDPTEFRRRFGCDLPDALHTELEGQASKGLLTEGEAWVPTPEGLFQLV